MTAQRTIAQVVSEQRIRVVLYLRISKDDRKAELGVKRQRPACEQLAATLNWEIVDTITENDSSNSIFAKTPRPKFDALMARILRGEVDAVISYQQDRFVKDEGEAALFCRANRDRVRVRGQRPMLVAWVTDEGQTINTNTPSGHASFMNGATQSTVETIKMSNRIQLKHAELSDSGKPAGRVSYGWRRVIVNDPQGYKIDWHDELHPEHAAIVRECARRVLGGESVNSIATDLTARDVPTPRAGTKRAASRWTVSTISRLLTRPANAAIRLDDDGKTETTLSTPPILTRADWLRLRVMLSDPARRTQTDTRVRHLLSHIATCGRCSGPMRQMTINATKRGAAYCWRGYICRDHRHLGMRQEDVELVVTETVIKFLDACDPATLLDSDENLSAEIALAAQQLDELTAELAGYVADSLRKIGDPLRVSKRELDERRKNLHPQIEDAQRRAMPPMISTDSAAYKLATSGDARRAWADLDLARQRSVIADLFDVTINAADPTHSRRSIDLDRVDVTRKGTRV